MNSEEQIKDIEKLIDSFFDGNTTCEQEQKLYTFFSQPDVPDHLVQYRPVFEYFEKGMADECELPVQPVHKAETPASLPVKKKNFMFWTSIAACFLIIAAGISFYIYNTRSFNIYEGSYIVRNGKRITNPDEIQNELERTIRYVNLQQEQAERLIQNISVQHYTATQVEATLKRQKEEIMSGIADEHTRKIVEEILQ